MNNIIQDPMQFFEVLKKDFSDLWSVKHRHNTIEFITPYTTLGGEAVSVFLTHRDIGYIVSDGGYLFDIAEEQVIDAKDNTRVHYNEMKEKYSIKETKSKDKRIFCYKVEQNINMLSTVIYDLACFQESVANAIYLETLFEKEESHEARYFAKRVRDLLYYKTQNLSTNTEKYEIFRDEKTRFLRFTTGIRKVGSELMWLGMTIHRSNLQNYERSVMSADFGFRRATRYFSHKNLSMSAIIDILPNKLNGNSKALFLQTEMNGWQTEFNISSFSLRQIEEMNSLQLLFPAA